jgi:hypothetical protein
MNLLVVATKSPWPPRDGGRLALWLTLQGLAEAGHAVALISPVEVGDDSEAMQTALRSVCEPTLVPVARRSWPAAALDSVRTGHALTVSRHRHRAVQAAVARHIAISPPDIVHVEQLQALANCTAAQAAGIPVVLRMQNVESSLWQQVARARWRSRGLLFEAHRLRTDERRAIAVCARTIALTQADADALRDLAATSDRARIVAIPPPFPTHLPAAPATHGAPALVLAGSAGWWPNRAGTQWFVDTVAPALRAALPGATIHIHGGDPIAREGIVWHAAPDDATEAFPDGAIAIVPLHIASGIRMRILDAWARGLPVIATTTAAAGLDVVPGRELLIADSTGAMVDAVRKLTAEPALAPALVASGRAFLAQHHDARKLTAVMIDTYASTAVNQGGSPGPLED